MDNEIDEGFITPEFLLDFFPYKDRFHCPLDRGLSFSKEGYIKYRTEINRVRKKSGKPALCDSDLRQIIESYFKTHE
ncbi:MAG: hypothetical protein PHH54_02300 [Candidatus Nanoarchaeia archaeon]|nr:hypothetical protein [Candidatus Nanoarchaeia archaeon]MDD5740793.1 hypothetical protein [Candidatus Nanoarchaeia archaeon]